MGTDRQTISINECARILGISRSHAYELARQGKLPGALRLGRRVVVSRPKLMAALGAEDSGSPKMP